MSRVTIEKTTPMEAPPRKLAVVPKTPEIERFDNAGAEEARNAARGAVGGMIIGAAFGMAVLGTIGSGGIPGLFEAILLVACGAFGGAMFGAIAGSTGLFASKPRR